MFIAKPHVMEQALWQQLAGLECVKYKIVKCVLTKVILLRIRDDMSTLQCSPVTEANLI